VPLVRIDLVQGRSDEAVRILADPVHEVMLDAFAVPDRDRYQVITEHPPVRMILEDTGLGLQRTSVWCSSRWCCRATRMSRRRRSTPGWQAALKSGRVCAPRISSYRWWATPAATGPSVLAGRSSSRANFGD
jgi:phenylpyruvate tautomerase PptA (4-oxalocrotonate tautomerase family)